MRFLGSEYNKRETVLLFIIAILGIAFFLQTWAAEKTIVENQNALTECMNNFVILQSGIQPDFYNFNITGGLNDTIHANS